MKFNSLLLSGLAGCAVLGATLLGTANVARAKVVALDLPAMMKACDGAVVGKIVERQVFRIDHPIDGPELFYTTITVTGRSLVDGQEQTVDMTFPGGFITEEEGVYNSESPFEQEVKIGNDVVAFYDWTDNMGGDVAGNGLVAAHGGLYQVENNRAGDRIVRGRGPGYAVSSNLRLEELDSEITRLIGEER